MFNTADAPSKNTAQIALFQVDGRPFPPRHSQKACTQAAKPHNPPQWVPVRMVLGGGCWGSFLLGHTHGGSVLENFRYKPNINTLGNLDLSGISSEKTCIGRATGKAEAAFHTMGQATSREPCQTQHWQNGFEKSMGS